MHFECIAISHNALHCARKPETSVFFFIIITVTYFIMPSYFAQWTLRIYLSWQKQRKHRHLPLVLILGIKAVLTEAWLTSVQLISLGTEVQSAKICIVQATCEQTNRYFKLLLPLAFGIAFTRLVSLMCLRSHKLGLHGRGRWLKHAFFSLNKWVSVLAVIKFLAFIVSDFDS